VIPIGQYLALVSHEVGSTFAEHLYDAVNAMDRIKPLAGQNWLQGLISTEFVEAKRFSVYTNPIEAYSSLLHITHLLRCYNAMYPTPPAPSGHSLTP
jgi:hypothetical protein